MPVIVAAMLLIATKEERYADILASLAFTGRASMRKNAGCWTYLWLWVCDEREPLPAHWRLCVRRAENVVTWRERVSANVVTWHVCYIRKTW